MKRYILGTALALAMGCFTSCDVLDVSPTDSLTDDAVWGDLALAETYLNECYMNVEAENAMITRFSSLTDEVHQMHTYWSEHATLGTLGPDYPYYGIGYDSSKYNMWSYYYGAIKEVNYFLEHIDQVPAETASYQEWKTELKGQGYFLRAYFYHMLYSLFGRVVLVKHTHSLDSEFNETRASLDEVGEYIVSQCDTAAMYLPTVYSDYKNFGRATKGAALALKGRVLLYMASPLFGTPSTEKWQRAADANKAVIDLGAYYLQPVSDWEDYADLFMDPDNPEVIFQRLFDTQYAVSPNNMVFYMQAPSGTGSGFDGWCAMVPTAEIVDRYQNADGTDFQPWTGTILDNPWENREIRLKANILCDGDYWGYGTSHREVEYFMPGESGVTAGLDSRGGPGYWNATLTGYCMRKFLDPNYDTNMEDSRSVDAPWFLLRLAEVYLNYAECLIELGKNGEALEYINKTRQRALLPAATGADIRAEYEQERLVELCFEGQRWFDLRRWKKLEEVYSHARYGVYIYKYLDGHKEYEHGTSVVFQPNWGGEKNYWMPIARSVNTASPQIDLLPYE